ncbi:MAG: diguanylate cyclase [Candidatus Limnocylindrales bacterium]
MPTNLLLLVLVALVIANIALMLAVLLLPARRNPVPAEPDRAVPSGDPVDLAIQVAASQRDSPEARAGLSGAAYDRVVRIVSYVFIAGTAVTVALSGLYPATASAIFVLLTVAALFVLIVHDLLPSSVLGPGKFVLEGSAAISFVTILIALTGAAESPFFFGYYLIVAGAALVVRGSTTLIVAASTSLVYVLLVAASPGASTLTYEQLNRIIFNVLALALLSSLASVVAREQRRTRDAALRLSLFDPLTQLYNRAYFFAVMDREIQRAARTGRRFCLLMLDLDGLKPINDTFGHHFGDELLRNVADVIRDGTRVIDSTARYGGDEFVVLLPETDPTGAFVVAEKLRQGVNRIRIRSGDAQLGATVSIGVVAYPDDGDNGDQLMMSADAAMYESKRKGKNRVVGRSGRRQTVVSAEPVPSRPSQTETDLGGSAPPDQQGSPPAVVGRDAAASIERAAIPIFAEREPVPDAQPLPDDEPLPDDDPVADDEPVSDDEPVRVDDPALTLPAPLVIHSATDPAGPGRSARRFSVLRGDTEEQFDRALDGLISDTSKGVRRRTAAPAADSGDEPQGPA